MARACLGASAALVAACLACALPADADPRPAEVGRVIGGDARLVGQAPYRVLVWSVFDAALWSGSGAFAWERPFALTLTYRRAFSAEALADRTVEEMTRRGYAEAAALRPRLVQCFADVAPGDRITGVAESASRARFFHNGAERCTLERRGFSRAFFGIWLEDQGAFSERLRGAR
ncbi:MAG: chalcone isomerase family protein [Hydrogenophilaceae bacterium]|jgi:hypothetical protein|nr:chalcone isomerase family protein [Hydrogenophilaceae bacterium]